MGGFVCWTCPSPRRVSFFQVLVSQGGISPASRRQAQLSRPDSAFDCPPAARFPSSLKFCFLPTAAASSADNTSTRAP